MHDVGVEIAELVEAELGELEVSVAWVQPVQVQVRQCTASRAGSQIDGGRWSRKACRSFGEGEVAAERGGSLRVEHADAGRPGQQAHREAVGVLELRDEVADAVDALGDSGFLQVVEQLEPDAREPGVRVEVLAIHGLAGLSQEPVCIGEEIGEGYLGEVDWVQGEGVPRLSWPRCRSDVVRVQQPLERIPGCARVVGQEVSDEVEELGCLVGLRVAAEVCDRLLRPTPWGVVLHVKGHGALRRP